MTSLFYSPFIQIFKIIFYTGRYMAYTKLNIHIYSPTSYAHDFFFFLLLIPERLQKISSLGLAFTWKHG